MLGLENEVVCFGAVTGKKLVIGELAATLSTAVFLVALLMSLTFEMKRKLKKSVSFDLPSHLHVCVELLFPLETPRAQLA